MLSTSTSDMQRVIDDIRLAVNSPGTMDFALLADSTALYAEACEMVNERLRRCGQLLMKGLRGEAIQLCEQEPNLLEMVSLLDFAELPAWNRLLEANKLAPPPPLLLDIAEQLNQSYADDQQLSRLLRQHRLLALGRAPLAARISVLRRIRAADADNPAWYDDIRVLEQARLRQLMGELQAAYRQENLDELTALVREVKDPTWIVPPPPEVVAVANDYFTRLRVKDARQSLESLAGQLDEAFAAYDVERGMALRGLWQSAASIAQLSSSDPLADRVAPALDWLEDQDRRQQRQIQYKQALSNLEDVLRQNVPRATLEQHYHYVLRFEEDVPPHLREGAEQRLRQFDVRARRRRALTLASIVGSILLIAGVTAGVVVWQIHNRQVAQATAALERLVAENKVDEAQEYLNDLTASSPRVAASSPIARLRERLETMVRSEQERVEKFKQALARAEAAGVDQPDRSALDEAKKLAVHAPEKLQVARLESDISAAARRRQDQVDADFSMRLQELRMAIDAMEALPESDQERIDNEISRLTAELHAARDTIGPSATLKRQVAPLLSRVDERREYWRVFRLQQTELAGALRVVGDPQRYAAALTSFTERFPESERNGDFKRVADEEKLWQGIQLWERWLRDRRLAAPLELDPKQASSLLEGASKLQDDYAGSPLEEHFEHWRPHLEAIAARVDDQGRPLSERVKALFNDSLVANLLMLESREGKRYYLVQQPKRYADIGAEDSFNFDHIVGFDMAERTGRMRKGDVLRLETAPQSVLAKEAAIAALKITNTNWDQAFASLYKQVSEHRDLDPVLRVAMLKRLVDLGSTGSYRFATAFARHKDLLGGGRVDLTVAWMVPDDESAIKNRIAAQGVLDELKKLTPGAPAPFPTEINVPTWLGIALKDSRGQWQCRTVDGQPRTGQLLIAVPRDEAAGEFEPVATVKAGRVAWDANHFRLLREGRPLFFSEADPPAE